MTTTTDYATKVDILCEVWTWHEDEKDFQYFFEMHDLGLPLAHLISNGIVESTPLAEEYINETWDSLMGLLKIEDTGFANYEELQAIINPSQYDSDPEP
jgi:hypothetical protein